MSKKELKKEIREMLEFCDCGKIVDWKILDYSIKPHNINLIMCDVITIKNHIVTKLYFTYDVEKAHLEVTDVKNLY